MLLTACGGVEPYEKYHDPLTGVVQDDIPLLPVGLEEDGEGACSHEFSWTPVSDPTCAAAGVERGTCPLCGGWADRGVDALGHEWEQVTVREADCLECWKWQMVCSVCGAEGEEGYGATGWHAWQEAELLDADGKPVTADICSVCGTLRMDESGVAEE